MLDQIAKDLAGINAPASTPMGGAFDLDAFIKALINAAIWAGEVAAVVFKAVTDFLNGVAKITATLMTDSVRYALYLLNKALFGIYRAIRDVLVLQAYTTPYTEEISGMFGPLDAESLWRSLGNAAARSHTRTKRCSPRACIWAAPNPAAPLTSPLSCRLLRGPGRAAQPQWPVRRPGHLFAHFPTTSSKRRSDRTTCSPLADRRRQRGEL